MTRLVFVLWLVPVLASAQEAFQLPSGNIHCQLWEATLRCEIRSYSYAYPAKPAECEADWGGAVTLDAKGGARMICYGDTITNPSHPVLGYGRAWQGPGMGCVASTVGLRCTNGAGRGFEMARATLRLF